MFDLDAGKMLIVGVIALIFIPPKDLPRVLRQAGQFVGKMRRMAADFQGQFMDAMREADVADIRHEAERLAEAARVDVGFDSVHDLDRQMVAKRPVERASPETVRDTVEATSPEPGATREPGPPGADPKRPAPAASHPA